jgi:SulP family sulfate permease
MLLVLVLASSLVAAFGWHLPRPDGPPLLATVGTVPSGLSPFHVPRFHVRWLHDMAGSVLAIALLGLLEALAIAKSISSRTREPLNFNRQCLAEGIANLGGGFFQCMPGSGSLTRSSINYLAGAVSRLSGVLAAAAVAVVVVGLAPLARFVPKAALAGILLVTAAGLIDWQRLRFALRASRYDAGLVVATALAAVFVSVELSILIGTFLSFLFLVPRAARLNATELVVGPERVIRDRQPDDPRCGRMVIMDFEGEWFFGASPELENTFDALRDRVKNGVRVIVLRVKRARNPDMVCLERLKQFLTDMQKAKTIVFLCGVREDFAQGLDNLALHRFLPVDGVFLEEAATGSSTLRAVRRAYELLGQDICDTCPRRSETSADKGDWYYMI